MKVEYVNAFLNSAAYVLAQFGEDTIDVGSISVKDEPIPSFEVGIVLGIVGDLVGEVIFSMSDLVARNLAGKMMMGDTVESLSGMELSALGEFGNIVAGGAVTRLYDQGVKLSISPPLVITGSGICVKTHKIKTIAVEIRPSFGIIEANVGLHEKSLVE